MIASEKLDEGECVFTIPRNILLEPKTSSISNILVELDHLPDESTRYNYIIYDICKIF